jgi:hypothetical protein
VRPRELCTFLLGTRPTQDDDLLVLHDATEVRSPRLVSKVFLLSDSCVTIDRVVQFRVEKGIRGR